MKPLNWIIVTSAILGLIGVRMLEDRLFYDPFLEYFHAVGMQSEFPKVEWIPLILNYIFRFLLNLMLSAVVVQFIFNNKKWTLQAVILILIVFAITFPIYLYCISTNFEIGYLFSFYMRRFVIQPLTLLLIIPLFYYRKKMMV